MNFNQWMALVENIVWKTTGCSADDLPDHQYWVWWENGLTQQEAAERAIKEAQSGNTESDSVDSGDIGCTGRGLCIRLRR